MNQQPTRSHPSFATWLRFYITLWRIRPKGGKFPFWPRRVF